MTIHGVTKVETATVQLRASGKGAQVAGSISIDMTDFGISPPTVPFTSVQPGVTIEVQLNLTKS